MGIIKDYDEFIQRKKKFKNYDTTNLEVSIDDFLNELFDYQKAIVKWALSKGKTAVWMECGLGKTLIQLEWAKQVSKLTNKPVIIFAPLSVSYQTKKEGLIFGYDVNLCESQSDVKIGINITNYEKIDKFIANEFAGIALDESSILKSLTGAFKNKLIEYYNNTPFKISLSATPAPNDYMEFGNQAEFLNIMTYTEMLSLFFINDSKDTTGSWRLKGHSENAFWDWLSEFAIYVENPSDIGFNGDGHVLPPLEIHKVIINDKYGYEENIGLVESKILKRESIDDRCKFISDKVNSSYEKWLVWVDLNDEGLLLNKLIKYSVEISGATDEHKKIKMMNDFADGKIKTMITKPKIAGFGMNWQVCNNIIFAGHTFSYESFHQCLRRCYRFGQTKPVNVYIIYTDKDQSVHDTLLRKQTQNENMVQSLKGKMKINLNDSNMFNKTEERQSFSITKPRFL